MVKNHIINHIFFDIGGVLLDIDPMKSLHYWSEHSGLDMDVFREKFPHRVHEEYEKGKMSDHDFFLSVQHALPKPKLLKEDDFWCGWTKLILAETETVTLLPELKKTYGVYLLSNTNPRHIHFEVKSRFTFHHHVHQAFYSFDLGSRKPEENIFLNALKLADAKAEESLFIDDLWENVEKAKILGFKTIHYKNHERTLIELVENGIKLYPSKN